MGAGVHVEPAKDEKTDASGEGLAALVVRADAGDRSARDALFTLLYSELHRLAEQQLRRAGGGRMTLGATTLLHEAYLSIADRDHVAFPDRNRFLGYAARAMRGLALNYIRDRHAAKRGGELTFTTLEADKAGAPAASAELEALSAALDELADLDAPLAELVDLHFFCGFTFAEIASFRGVSERTVQRDWTKARVVLRRFLDEPQERC